MDGRPRRKRWVKRLGVSAVALLLGLGALVFWHPWQSVKVAGSACWGELTAPDYRALAGSDGSLEAGTVEQQGDEWTARACDLMWGRATVLVAGIEGTSDQRDKLRESQAGGTLEALDLGSETIAWMAQAATPDIVAVVHCVPGPATPEKFIHYSDSYVEVHVSGDPSQAAGSKSAVRQVYLNVTLKLAKAAVRHLGCANDAKLPDEVRAS